MIDPYTGLDDSVKMYNPTLKDSPLANMKQKAVETGKDSPLANMKRRGTGSTPVEGTDDSQYDMNLSLDEVRRKGVNILRAGNQPFHHEMANSLAQLAGGEIVGGGIEGFGYLLELAKLNGIAVDSENFLLNTGRNIRESLQESNPIYQSNPDQFMLFNHENFWQNFISMGSTLSMMIPAMGTTRAILGGLSKLARMTSRGARVLDSMKKVGQINKINGIFGATVSRQIENNLEAYGVYEQVKDDLKGTINPKTGNPFTRDEIEEAAMTAAQSTYYKNWVMLAQDIPQYLAVGKIYNSLTGQFVDKTARKAGKYAAARELLAQAGWEGAEEGYQYVSAEESVYNLKNRYDLVDKKTFGERMGKYLTDVEMWNAVTAGAMGGAVFHALGKQADKVFNSAERKRIENLHAELAQERGQMMANLHEDIRKADEEGDAAASLNARKKWNIYRTMEAVESDSYEQHIEFLESLQKATPEELQEFKEKYGANEDFNKEFIDSIVPELIKDADTLREKYLKYRNKYQEAASHITIGEYKRDVLVKIRDEAEAKRSEIVGKHPTYKNLSGVGKQLFDIQAQMRALEFEFLLEKLSVEMGESDQERLEAYGVAVKELLDEYKTELAEISKEDTRTKKEKKSDKDILDTIENNQELFQAIARAEHAKKSVIREEKNLKHYRTKKFLTELRDKAIEREINAAKTKDELESMIPKLKEKRKYSQFKDKIESKSKALASKEAEEKAEKQVKDADEKDAKREAGQDDTIDDSIDKGPEMTVAKMPDEEADNQATAEDFNFTVADGSGPVDQTKETPEASGAAKQVKKTPVKSDKGFEGSEQNTPVKSDRGFQEEEDPIDNLFGKEKPLSEQTTVKSDRGFEESDAEPSVPKTKVKSDRGFEVTEEVDPQEAEFTVAEDTESIQKEQKAKAKAKDKAEKTQKHSMRGVTVFSFNENDSKFNEVSSYWDWVFSKNDKQGTPVRIVLGYDSVDKKETDALMKKLKEGTITDAEFAALRDGAEFKAVVLDNEGNPIEIDGKPVWNYIFKITSKSDVTESAGLRNFRAEALRRLAKGEEVMTKVQGMRNLDWNNQKTADGRVAENNLRDVFENFDESKVIYSDSNGNYYYMNGKRVGGLLEKATKSGLMFYLDTDNRGLPLPVKLNRTSVEGPAAEFVYSMYVKLMTGKIKYKDVLGVSEIVALRNIVPEMDQIFGENIEVWEAINFFARQGKETKGAGTLKTWGKTIIFGRIKDGTTKDGKPKYKQRRMSLDEFTSEEGKAQFMQWLASQKGRHVEKIRFRDNEAYRNYIINSNVLNSDLDPDKPYTVIHREYGSGKVYLENLKPKPPKPKASKTKPKAKRKTTPTKPELTKPLTVPKLQKGEGDTVASTPILTSVVSDRGFENTEPSLTKPKDIDDTVDTSKENQATKLTRADFGAPKSETTKFEEEKKVELKYNIKNIEEVENTNTVEEDKNVLASIRRGNRTSEKSTKAITNKEIEKGKKKAEDQNPCNDNPF